MRGVAAVALASSPCGTAATTTMFSAAYAALCGCCPCRARAPGHAVHDAHHTAGRAGALPVVAPSSIRWRRWSAYESIASYTPALISLSGGSGDPEQIDGEIVSPAFRNTALRQPPDEPSRRTRIARRGRARGRPQRSTLAFATARIHPLSGARSASTTSF
jgi:hypothetical protein